MKISTNAVITNQFNQVLLVRRNDSRTWATPGGMMEAGELPPEAVTREVREETGLIIMPVRLVALHLMQTKPTPFLGFSFRCIRRGGELEPSPETPQLGWVKANELPWNISSFHKERLTRGLAHAGGPPVWFKHRTTPGMRLGWLLLSKVIYPWMDLRRRMRGQPPYQPPPSWQMSAFAVLRNEQGEVLWVRRQDQDVWNLPGGVGLAGEAPWETAVRETQEETGLHVTLTDLPGVYVYRERPHMAFTFTAEISSGALTPGPESTEFAYFTPGDEPANSAQQHRQRVADAVSPHEETIFRRQEGPHLLT